MRPDRALEGRGAVGRDPALPASGPAVRGKRNALLSPPPAAPLRQIEETLVYDEDWSEVETRDAIERATAPHSRERAMLLAVADGYTVTEAAARTGLSRQTAARKLRRGARRLGLTVASRGKMV